MMVILLMIMPRYYDSMHPGKGGNPAFDTYDLDSNLRMVFYPAVIQSVSVDIGFIPLKIEFQIFIGEVMNKIKHISLLLVMLLLTALSASARIAIH